MTENNSPTRLFRVRYSRHTNFALDSIVLDTRTSVHVDHTGNIRHTLHLIVLPAAASARDEKRLDTLTPENINSDEERVKRETQSLMAHSQRKF